MSGRRHDLMQKDRVKIVIRSIYMKHWEPLRDLFFRMGILEGYIGRETCKFCQATFSTWVFGERAQSDSLPQLLNHYVNHYVKDCDRQPLDRYLHILAILISCYMTKGIFIICYVEI